MSEHLDNVYFWGSHFNKLLQHLVLLLSHSEVNESSDKTSVLNRKSNKLPLLTWTCIPSFGFSSAN